MDDPIECLVLAGGAPDSGHPLHGYTKGRPKAVLELAGKPMVRWVLDALAGTGRIGRIVVVGLDEEAGLDCPGDIVRIRGGGTWTDNFFAGIEVLDRTPGRLAAFCWSDIPLIEPPMLDRFLDEVGQRPRLVHAGLVRRETLEARFGRLDEPWLRLREGQFVAADFGVFQPAAAARLRSRLEELAPQRKSAIRQARTVGWGLLLRYLLGRLSIAHLERRLATAYDISCRVHIVADAEMGLDVDAPTNLEICRSELARRSHVTSDTPRA
jgi:molybdopterin-guanine dinucleotide biosynthesis protein A